ncbi:SDR family oxidoreductase [Paenibacillus sp. LjRoot153]|uniref:SDR family oxidoreductase n=1 Tax=Paenibacillus sp. LjRoot153 TaxID=3342270 RepID=UPI003ED150B4
MQDSLNWIETLNPDKQNERMLGFNYYGRSIIDKNGAVKFIKIMKAWYCIFDEAPEDIILTGRYTWSEDDEGQQSTGEYERLKFNRREVLDLLNRLTEFENIKDSLHAYQMAKRCNVKRVMFEAIRWGEKNARINSISPGIIVTPLAIDEFNGPRGDFYKNMFSKCPAGRPGTADEVANVAELLMMPHGAFITGSDFLIDGGATASYFYGLLKPVE